MPTTLALTRHAIERCCTRHIPVPVVEAAIAFGRERSTRIARIYTLRWVDIRDSRRPELIPWEGTEVVCSREGDVITVYRNYRVKNAKVRRDAPRCA